jgi:hypothetical protein
LPILVEQRVTEGLEQVREGVGSVPGEQRPIARQRRKARWVE